MNGLLPHRSAVFLNEMGVGTQWRLRTRPAAVADVALADADAAAEAASAAAHAATEVAAEVVAIATVTPAEVAPVVADDAFAPAVPPAPPVAQEPAAAQAAVPSARPSSVPAESAWDDDAPTALQPAAARPAQPPQRPVQPPQRPVEPPQPPASSLEDDSMAWFDEAPAAPATTPARRAPESGPVSDEEIAQMDWPTLRASIDSCTRCRLCQTREAAVNGRGDEQASWLILDAAPNTDDEEYAEPVTGNPGRLLDNMLRAVNQSTQQGAYITSLVKCRPSNEDGTQRAPTQEELQACRPYLERELQLTQAKVIVAIGHTAGKGLLGAAARGRILMHAQTPVVATYHPSDLLKRPEEKAKAWADLCLAKSAHAGRR
jgi:DNA polymerase